MMKLLTCILLFMYSATLAQAGKKERILTYYYFGTMRGHFVDTESLYGFKLKWKRCVIKNRHIRHNERVERKLNERLGDNWLAQNFEKFEIGFSE